MTTPKQQQIQTQLDALQAQNSVTDDMKELAARVAKERIEFPTCKLEGQLKSATLAANPHLQTLGHREDLAQGEKLLRRKMLNELIEHTVEQAATSEGVPYRANAEINR